MRLESFGKDPDVGTFRPFLSQGTVEVDGCRNTSHYLETRVVTKLSSKRVLLRRGRLTKRRFGRPLGKHPAAALGPPWPSPPVLYDKPTCRY
ncbi:hypothetical protein Hamer_G023517 [Homarus americanus]|uniref:Uncharacterized protein n=1 Tax=Homarus americanus TaxID=6706 RepID=A0A8J5MWD0_HOMAM|nr:hypothetical protein Hamer_G023517 [Homarus americanus]